MTFKRVSLINAVLAAWDTYRKNARFFLTASAVGILISVLFLGIHFLGLDPRITYETVYETSPSSESFKWSLNLFPGMLYGIFSFLVYSLLNYQVLYASMAMYKGEVPSWKSFFVFPSRNFIRFFFAQMRFFLIAILLGCLLLVPSLLYISSHYFAGYSILHSLESFFVFLSQNFIRLFFAQSSFFLIAMLLGCLLLIPGLLYISSHYFAGYSILHSLTDSLKKDALMSRVITKDNRLRILLLALINGLITVPLSLIGLNYISTPFLLLVNLGVYNQLRELHNEAVTVVP
ncbi:hypothetical protein H0W26_06195 [Candidatus Dependentiae bacterium]|nr:hypothetical protein [Candidatus Dependentiae bacterium]